MSLLIKQPGRPTKPLQHSHTYIPTPTMPFPFQSLELKVPADTGPLCILQMCTPTQNRQSELTNTSKIPGDSVVQLHGNKHSKQETNPESCSCFMLALWEAKDMLLSCRCLICK